MRPSYIFYIFFLVMAPACKKDFLAEKPRKSLMVPTTIKEFQALLDNYDIMNTTMPITGELGSDNYYLTDDVWKGLGAPVETNSYIWRKDIYEGTPYYDWNLMYRMVFYANVVLEGLNGVDRTEDPVRYDEIKGAAFFYRAYAFYQLAQIFCMPYNASTASADLGIPLRLISDINLPTARATVEETYDRIFKDLAESVSLLPISSKYNTRPSRVAAFAMLSRMGLLVQDYPKALQYADSALKYKHDLIEFDKLNTSLSNPLTNVSSTEIIFYTTLAYTRSFTAARMNVDSTLYSTYVAEDVRKRAWYRLNSGRVIFRGSYSGSPTYLFGGLAVDEVYLTKAEAMVRLGDVSEGLKTLAVLMKSRFESGNYQPPNTNDQDVALSIVLQERRKELVFRGVRWSDLRRLNLEPGTATTLERVVDGTVYKLRPNSLNYVLPIPDQVIQMSGIQQNPRE